METRRFLEGKASKRFFGNTTGSELKHLAFHFGRHRDRHQVGRNRSHAGFDIYVIYPSTPAIPLSQLPDRQRFHLFAVPRRSDSSRETPERHLVRRVQAGKAGASPQRWRQYRNALLALLLCWSGILTAQPFDVLIRNGHIIDGTGSPWYSGDIGIRAGRIAADRLSAARARRQDDRRSRHGCGAGIHRHAGPVGNHHPRQSASAFKNLPGHHHGSHRRRGFRRSAQRRRFALPTAPVTSNTASGPIGPHSANTSRALKSRASVSTSPTMWARHRSAGSCWADDNRAPTPAELEQMKRACARCHARRRRRSLHLASVCARALCENRGTRSRSPPRPVKLGGIYATHMRSEGDAIIPALDEAIRIGREGHIPVEIWHLKAAGKSNWGRMPEIVAHIERRAPLGRRYHRRYLCLYRPGSIHSPPSFRRGRTMAATRSSSSA